MGIYIKTNCKLPDNCEECPLDVPFCSLWRESEGNALSLERHKDCPLVEIPIPSERPIYSLVIDNEGR